jgi:hypothetical protein
MSLGKSIITAKIKTIKLTKNKLALVDDEDFKYLSRWKWCVTNIGYAVRSCPTYQRRNAKTTQHILMHREILKAGSGQLVDHINMNKLDNRRQNLRLCTQSENLRHRHKSKARIYTSQYKGVSFDKSRGKYEAYITINLKKLHLGRFNSEQEAAHAYNKASSKHYKEFVILNNIRKEDKI